jgi:hypothetical protein
LIDSAHIRNITASKITAGTINAHEIILKQQGAQTTITAPANMAILRSSNYNGSYNNSTSTWSSGTAGWVIGGDGYAEFGAAAIRGGLKASSVWIDTNNRWNRNAADTANVSEFKAGSATKYLYFDGTNLTFTGNLSAAGGTFSGDLSAAGGTFSGNLSAVGGTFSGDLSAAGGTFSGDISGANGTFTGDLSGSTIIGGSININGGTFQVLSDGSLTATSADITGEINATSGTFSGSITSTATISGGTILGALITTGGFSVDAGGAISTMNITCDFDRTLRSYSFPTSTSGATARIESLASVQRITAFSSTQKIKKNIQDISNALDLVKQLKPREFNYNDLYYGDIDPSTEEPWTQQAKELHSLYKDYGFIAEEIQNVNPQLVVYKPNEIGSLDVSKWEPSMWKDLSIIAILTKAIQELSDKVDYLESKI